MPALRQVTNEDKCIMALFLREAANVTEVKAYSFNV
jgi:hypothetical protein